MSLPFRQFPRWPLLAAALALPLAACFDVTSTPTAADPRGAARSTASAAEEPRLFPNSARYRDTGKKPATGRSGSATLAVQALQGKDGVTEVEITTGEIGQEGAPGELSKVQIKAMQPDGRHLSTFNQGELAQGGRLTYGFPGLGLGIQLQTQANVRGIDGNRTDVVTVTETVKRRPDLEVRLAPQGRVMAGSPVVVSATVSELNGDVGARARCVLLVDGQETDRAEGIWVDAGDAVTCAFSQVFQTAGVRKLEVRADAVRPGDFDPSNNSASAEIKVFEESGYAYSAWVQDFEWRSRYRVQHRWTDLYGGSGEYGTETLSDQWHHSARLEVLLPRAVSFPLTRVEVSQETGGRMVHSAVVENAEAYDWGYGPCADLWFSPGLFLFVCTSEDGSSGTTSIRYVRSVGRVTYHSWQYSRGWDQYSGTEYFYTYNHSFTDQPATGPLFQYGSDYTFSISLAEGDSTWTARHVVPLEVHPGRDYSLGGCNTEADPWYPSRTEEVCWTDEGYVRSASGSASSPGPQP